MAWASVVASRSDALGPEATTSMRHYTTRTYDWQVETIYHASMHTTCHGQTEVHLAASAATTPRTCAVDTYAVNTYAANTYAVNTNAVNT